MNSVIWMGECILLTNIVYLLLTQAHRTTDQLFVYYRANCSGNQSLRQHSLAEVIQKANEMAVRLTLARVYVVSPPYWFHGRSASLSEFCAVASLTKQVYFIRFYCMNLASNSSFGECMMILVQQDTLRTMPLRSLQFRLLGEISSFNIRLVSHWALEL